MSTSPDLKNIREGVEAFAKKYNYPVDYMLYMLEKQPDAFQAFQGASAMSNCRKHAPFDVFMIAKISGFLHSDCGSCLQLAIDMAIEGGLSREIVEAAVKGTGTLPEHLQEVQTFVRSLESYNEETDRLRESLRSKYGDAALVEIAMAITAAELYPRAKRVLGFFKSCQLVNFTFGS